ncbi:MAG: hypothetical protein Q4A56_07265 [Porphyromonadaceae bacterium]|nr:hypothetical protein [Porphyromonadaceae bacterium]
MEVALLVGLNDMTTYQIFTVSYPNIEEFDHSCQIFMRFGLASKKLFYILN